VRRKATGRRAEQGASVGFSKSQNANFGLPLFSG
jgi:hypothetical protein